MSTSIDKYVDYTPAQPDPRDSRSTIGAYARFYVAIYRTKDLKSHLKKLAEILESNHRLLASAVYYHKKGVIGIGFRKSTGQNFTDLELRSVQKIFKTLSETKAKEWRVIPFLKGLKAASGSAADDYQLRELPKIADTNPHKIP